MFRERLDDDGHDECESRLHRNFRGGLLQLQSVDLDYGQRIGDQFAGWN
jgi:hypothetical protein